jgi:hypothetical protein
VGVSIEAAVGDRYESAIARAFASVSSSGIPWTRSFSRSAMRRSISSRHRVDVRSLIVRLADGHAHRNSVHISALFAKGHLNGLHNPSTSHAVADADRDICDSRGGKIGR